MKYLLLIIAVLFSVNCIAQNRFTKIVASADSEFHAMQDSVKLNQVIKEIAKEDSALFFINNSIPKEVMRLMSPTQMGLGATIPYHTVSIMSPDHKHQLNLDFEGDSIKVSGNMKLDYAAYMFFRYVIECNSRKIDSLKKEIRKLKL